MIRRENVGALVTEHGQLAGLVSLREMAFPYVPEKDSGEEN